MRGAECLDTLRQSHGHQAHRGDHEGKDEHTLTADAIRDRAGEGSRERAKQRPDAEEHADCRRA